MVEDVVGVVSVGYVERERLGGALVPHENHESVGGPVPRERDPNTVTLALIQLDNRPPKVPAVAVISASISVDDTDDARRR